MESHSLSIDWWLGSVPRYWTCLIFICISVGDSRVVELVVQQLCNVLKLLNIWHFKLITRHITGNPISATYYRSVYNPQLLFQGDQKKINFIQLIFKLHCMQWHYFQTESSHHICIELLTTNKVTKALLHPLNLTSIFS